MIQTDLLNLLKAMGSGNSKAGYLGDFEDCSGDFNAGDCGGDYGGDFGGDYGGDCGGDGGGDGGGE
ncbi:hypothetical protein PO909_015986 [Leuciscus waleckii]